MTKREALEGCVALWDWLAENPGADKDEWPDWDKTDGYIEHNCLACHYYMQKHETINYGCQEECIVPVFRKFRERDEDGNAGCSHVESPFIKWEDAKPDELELAAKYAKQIADSAREELKNELLPCPFCGTTNISIVPSKTTNYLSHFMVGCATCHIDMMGDTRKDAVEAWNRRTDEK